MKKVCVEMPRKQPVASNFSSSELATPERTFMLAISPKRLVDSKETRLENLEREDSKAERSFEEVLSHSSSEQFGHNQLPSRTAIYETTSLPQLVTDSAESSFSTATSTTTKIRSDSTTCTSYFNVDYSRPVDSDAADKLRAPINLDSHFTQFSVATPTNEKGERNFAANDDSPSPCNSLSIILEANPSPNKEANSTVVLSNDDSNYPSSRPSVTSPTGVELQPSSVLAAEEFQLNQTITLSNGNTGSPSNEQTEIQSQFLETIANATFPVSVSDPMNTFIVSPGKDFSSLKKKALVIKC